MSGTLINADTTTTLRANKVKTPDEENILKMDILLPNEKGTYDQTEVNRNKRHLLSVKDNPKEFTLPESPSLPDGSPIGTNICNYIAN